MGKNEKERNFLNVKGHTEVKQWLGRFLVTASLFLLVSLLFYVTAS